MFSQSITPVINSTLPKEMNRKKMTSEHYITYSIANAYLKFSFYDNSVT